jgi:hypothetical protein
MFVYLHLFYSRLNCNEHFEISLRPHLAAEVFLLARLVR